VRPPLDALPARRIRARALALESGSPLGAADRAVL